MSSSENHTAAWEAPQLTPRQSEILALVASGLSTQDIATRLGISTGTIKTHLHAVYRLIGARNRVQATRYYLDHLGPGT